MIQNFERHIDILRKIGNKRLPYVIFIDIDGQLDYDLLVEKSAIKLAISKHVLYPENLLFALPTEITGRYDSIDSLIDKVLCCDKTICIIFGHSFVLESEATLLFNEIHSMSMSKHSCLWHLAFEAENYRAYTKCIIDNPDIIAIGINQQFAKTLQEQATVVEYKPWITTLYNKSTNYFVQVVWDTRVIIGYGKLDNTNDIEQMLQSKNINDNSFLLYDNANVPADAGFDSIIIDKVSIQ